MNRVQKALLVSQQNVRILECCTYIPIVINEDMFNVHNFHTDSTFKYPSSKGQAMSFELSYQEGSSRRRMGANNCVYHLPGSVYKLIAECKKAERNQGECCELAFHPEGPYLLQGDIENWRLKTCDKYTEQEHEDNYIPIKDFKIEQLQGEMRCKEWFDYIKYCALHTVLITVRFSSADRPDKFRCGVQPGKTRITGTGFVFPLYQTDENIQGFEPGKSFMIQTAAHVIYNDEEAKHVTVEFFFDDEKDRYSLFKAAGVRVVYRNVSEDWCMFICNVKSLSEGRKVRKRLNEISLPSLPPHHQDLSLCVSHPHGLPLRLSIGQTHTVVEEKMEETWFGKHFLFIVCTCVCDLSIDEKKILFVYLKDFYIKNVYYTLSNMDDKSQTKYTDYIISHLEKKTLVKKPTQTEYDDIKSKYKELIELLDRECDKEQTLKHGTKTIRSEDRDTIEYDMLNKQLNHVTISNCLLDTYREIDLEIYRKYYEMRTGDNYDTDIIYAIKSATYSTPTCPGSSGALIRAFKNCTTGRRRFDGVHSKGVDGGNMSGGGESYHV